MTKVAIAINNTAKPPVPTVEELTAAFQKAKEAGEQANNGDDGGASNFDTAVIQGIPFRYSERVQAAAKAVGLIVQERKWFGPAHFIHLDGDTGQGFRRTNVARAICLALTEAGLTTQVYYQAD